MEETSSEEIESQQRTTSLAQWMVFITQTRHQLEMIDKKEMDYDLWKKLDKFKQSFQDIELDWLKVKKRTAIRVEKKLTLLDVDTVRQDGSAKTDINTKPKLNDDVREKKMKDFATENRKKLKALGILKHYDDSEEYLQENPQLVCENTANCLVAWCINLEIKEKHLWMEYVAHQCICMQFILELSKQLDVNPKACVSSFFTKIQAVDHFEYKKSFDDELEAFKARIKKLSAEKVAETFKEIEEEQKLTRSGQGGLNLNQVFELLPKAEEDHWETDYEENSAFYSANDTRLDNHEEFKERIASAKKIRSISLGLFNPIEMRKLSSNECIYLANQLKDSNIENLQLSEYTLDDEVTAIFSVLKHTKIKNLNLKQNKLRMNRLRGLSTALKESKIEILNLSGYNSLSDEIPILANSLPFSKVTSLDLGFIPIEFPNFKHLSDTLAQTKITVLKLGYCSLNNMCIEYLSTKLTNSKIQILDLSGNKMTFGSFKSLADVLENTAITELNIASNRIGSTGATYLAERLHKSVLQKLNIGFNRIKSEGCLAIGNVIHLTPIIELNLGTNSIDSGGITSLAENLKKSNVKHLNLNRNNLQINGARILADGIKDSDLEHLNVDRNKLQNIGMGLILDALQYTKITDFDLDCMNNGMEVENMRWVTNAFQFLKLKNLSLTFPDHKNIIQSFFNELKTLIESDELDEILPIKNKMSFILNNIFHIDTEDKKCILDVFKHFHMKKLSFTGNFINFDETLVSSVLEVLLLDINNPISNITTLDLSYIHIGDCGAALLAKNLKYSKLTQLKLLKADIKNYGIISIAKELKNSQIRYLNLTFNKFDSSAASYLTNVVEKHPVRIELDYEDQNGFSAEEKLVIKNINYMFLKAQLLVQSISENSPVKYDKHLIEHLKAYEIFKNVDLLWESKCGKDNYDYNRVNSQIRSKVTKNFLKIIGVANSDTIYSSVLPTEILIMICSYLRINDIKFN